MRLDNYAIEIAQGDSIDISLLLRTRHGKAYRVKDSDKLFFMAQQKFVKNPTVIKKEIPLSTMKIYFSPEETLNIPHGEYRYDVMIITEDHEKPYVETFILDKSFIVKPRIISD